MQNEKRTVLYIGGFELPDKNAAAHRVLGVAKLFRAMGFKVEFINKTNEDSPPNEIEDFKIKNTSKPRSPLSQVCSLFEAKDVINYLKCNDNIACVVAYNYPSYALNKIIRYCKKNGIKCIADVTEWYKGFYVNPFKVLTKGVDSWYRMRIVHKKCDGIIAISNYLEDYYLPHTNVVNIPPVVDKTDSKWNQNKEQHNGVVFVYAGSPSRTKERLDLIVDAIESLDKSRQASLFVVGITKSQFLKMYNLKSKVFQSTVFVGKKTHRDALNCVAQSDYSFLIRDTNRVTKAGFPTKFVESISVGCAVIANDNSNISAHLKDDCGGYLVNESDLANELEKIIRQPIPTVDTSRFDYHKYIEPFSKFIENIIV